MPHIAFIGAGGRAGKHLDTISTMEQADVVAICDVNEEAAREAAEPHNATVYTDHAKMYEAETDLDAVFVCLPPFAHTDQEVMAAERGIDLFVEKPLALTAEKAEEIRNTIAANDVISSVGYQLRYDDATQRALDLIDGRTVGLVEGYYKSGVPGGPNHWWREYERSGGQVVEQATHIYDLVRVFGGDVDSVSAVGSHKLVDEIDFEDAVTTNIVHENDVISSVTTTSASPRHSAGIELIGEDLYLQLEGSSLSGVVDDEEIEYEGKNDCSQAAVEAFISAVDTGDTSGILADYAEAMHSFKLTLSVEQSLNA